MEAKKKLDYLSRDRLVRFDGSLPAVVDVKRLQYFFAATRAVRRQYGDGHNDDDDDKSADALPSALREAMTAFRMAVTNQTALEEREGAERELKQQLEAAGLLDAADELATDIRGDDVVYPLRRDLEEKAFAEMQLVLPGLYIGSYHPAANKEYLSANSITHICCCINVDPRFPDEFQYVTLPADDHPDQDMTQYFEKTNAFIQGAIDQGGRVLVHCGAGISRASTVTLAYMLAATDLTLDEAFSHLRMVRPVISPNRGFVHQLRKYEASLRKAQAQDK